MCSCCGICGQKVRKYTFWTLIAILTALTIHDVIQLFMEYFENPKIADMGYVFNETMRLPLFTICIPSPMVLSIFNSSLFDKPDNKSWDEAVKADLKRFKSGDDFKTLDWDWRTVHDAYVVLAKIHSLEREAGVQFVANGIKKAQKRSKSTKELAKIQKWIEIIEKRDVTFMEFMQKTGDEVLRRMVKKAQRTSLDNDDVYDAQFKVTWISEPNFCFQPYFTGNGTGPITAQGNWFFFKLGHDPRKVEGPQQLIIDMNGRRANLAHFVDAGGHTSEGVNNGIQAGSISDMQVEIRTVYELVENSDPGTKCVDLENDDDTENDGEFTPVFECRARCRTDLIRELCGCTPVSTAYLGEKEELNSYPLCDYSKCKLGNDSNTNHLNEKKCVSRCRHGCTVTRYTVKQLSIHPAIILNANTHQPMAAPNQTSFFLTWGSFEFLHLEQSYKYDSLVSFLSELGGALGIWLGLSVLTLLQGSLFITGMVHTKVQERRKKSQPGGRVQPNDRKYSSNPFGSANVSENPFADFTGKNEPRKRKTSKTESTS